MYLQYLKEIFGLFRNLLVNFYIAFMDRIVFAKIIDEIFNVNASLYNAISIKSKRSNGVSCIQLSTPDDTKKRAMLASLNDDAQLFVLQRVSREAEWRISLKAGDYVDCISHWMTPNSNSHHYIKGWSVGKILKVDRDNFLVSFIGRS